MTFEEWEEKFKPLERSEGNILGETYGEDLEVINKNNVHFVWTLIDGDEGLFIIPGKRWVNRLNYILTEIPWDENYQLLEIEY